MKAALSRRYGPPETMTLEDVPAPAVDDQTLLVRVHATTVNRTDCGFRSATPMLTRAFTGVRRPRQPIFGSEFAGVVDRVGNEVTRFRPGERVFGYTEPKFGCHADYVAVDQDATSPRSPRA
ncbi:MAG: alcohol dehydrogenase catalytic domain-containing protein [Nocardioides sp.]|nr:alcohol dehydrogenase catalytic domain-containing protein [Nocardioides sp.]